MSNPLKQDKSQRWPLLPAAPQQHHNNRYYASSLLLYIPCNQIVIIYITVTQIQQYSLYNYKAGLNNIVPSSSDRLPARRGVPTWPQASNSIWIVSNKRKNSVREKEIVKPKRLSTIKLR